MFVCLPHFCTTPEMFMPIHSQIDGVQIWSVLSFCSPRDVARVRGTFVVIIGLMEAEDEDSYCHQEVNRSQEGGWMALTRGPVIKGCGLSLSHWGQTLAVNGLGIGLWLYIKASLSTRSSKTQDFMHTYSGKQAHTHRNRNIHIHIFNCKSFGSPE